MKSFRERISEADREILATFNRRLGLVSELHAYKDEQGYPMVDQAREGAMAGQLADANPGPLSTDGVNELVTEILRLTKRELARKA